MNLALGALALLIVSITATEAADSITVAGHEITVGDTFEFALKGLDNIKSGVVQEVRCESNGTGLVVLRVQDGRILEIEHSLGTAIAEGHGHNIELQSAGFHFSHSSSSLITSLLNVIFGRG